MKIGVRILKQATSWNIIGVFSLLMWPLQLGVEAPAYFKAWPCKSFYTGVICKLSSCKTEIVVHGRLCTNAMHLLLRLAVLVGPRHASLFKPLFG